MRRVILVVAVLAVASCARTGNVEQEQAALMAVTTEWGTTGSDIDTFTSFLAPNARLS